MEDIKRFSEQLSDLIKENEQLKAHIKNTEEWFKLAIAVNNKLQFRTKEKVDDLTYDHFINGTSIAYSGDGISLYWSEYKPIEFEGRMVPSLGKVQIDEIEAIFNGKKLF